MKPRFTNILCRRVGGYAALRYNVLRGKGENEKWSLDEPRYNLAAERVPV